MAILKFIGFFILQQDCQNAKVGVLFLELKQGGSNAPRTNDMVAEYLWMKIKTKLPRKLHVGW